MESAVAAVTKTHIAHRANEPVSLADAVALAARAHGDALDKGGALYLLHPLRVMFAVPESAKIAAVLHDVVEDTGLTLDDLFAEGLADPHLTAVDLLTRPDADEPNRPSYKQYVHRIATYRGPAGDIARTVKLYDIADNLRRMTPELEGLERRYAWAVREIKGNAGRLAA